MNLAPYAIVYATPRGYPLGYWTRAGLFSFYPWDAARFTTAGDAVAFAHTHDIKEADATVVCFTRHTQARITAKLAHIAGNAWQIVTSQAAVAEALARNGRQVTA